MMVPIVALSAAPASGDTSSFTVSAFVPVHCRVGHQGTATESATSGSVSLGVLREYCNAPAGYALVVNYTPGTMKGASVSVGEDSVVLNGSGQAVLSRAVGPRWRNRPLAAVPGEAGFDTDILQFDVQPS